ncbi:dihydroxyacetone kinase phosphoryl donor subunit DhaM [Jeotgalibacillus soli]|uniref:phosphoenolpyruvate--glycerone phosphotransferase n=1 Tax=Jeotgalibacillus soli TaxID=889306 RepID=A0A0C2RGU0_9BACL|nr:dihydroxyacetone kinase phosphoryl donor subunit DhaM [Jeotgalibacillus soli]KIL49390.1 hypothetical protein KP78_08580 [Jeotgalibacillus soli]
MSAVGIVLISHSDKIAEGLYELLRQVEQNVAIELAGGTDEGGIGTSLDKILQAIEKADSGEGVLLFYDLGSAKMNAELAIELAGKDNAYLVEAPLIEGAYIGTVEAGIGKRLHDIIEGIQKQFTVINE